MTSRVLSMLFLGLLLGLALSAAGCLDESGPSDAAVDGSGACTTDPDCDDGLFCNGVETCSADSASADARGCVAGSTPCGATTCDEDADRCEASDCATAPDADGDGHAAIACGGDDCDDTDADVSPSATELCDEAGVDEDCDPTTFGSRDLDEDGVVDAACCNGERCGGDCDDASASVRPGASEVCNSADDDCDGSLDEGIERTRYYVDGDADGYGARGSEGVLACARPDGTADNDLDCNDGSADVSPVAAERCNEADDDCDGDVDEVDDNVFYRDADGDGWGDVSDSMALASCDPPSGYVGRSGDCDDARATTYPGADELCNGRDDDCSPELLGALDPREDADGDGHAPLDAACEGGFPRDDCDDARAVAYLGAVEVCSGRDEDCDTNVDEGSDAQCASGTCDAGCVSDRSIAIEGDAICALRAGVPHCWGQNPASADAPVGHPSLALRAGLLEEHTPIALPVTGGRSITVSRFVACAVLSDGSVRCWGANETGQLGVGDTDPRTSVVTPLGLDGVVQLASADDTVCALRAEGDVRCWGRGESFQIGDGGEASRFRPTPVLGLDRAVELVGAGATFCARRYDGGVWCWGEGPVGDGMVGGHSVPRFVLGGAHELAAGGLGSSRTFCGRIDAGWRCWGVGGALGGTTTAATMPQALVTVPDPIALALGVDVGCAIRSDRSVACWGFDDARLADAIVGGARAETGVSVGLPDADELVCGEWTCCARSGDTITCRGAGRSLAFGDGLPRVLGPVDGFGLTNARSVALGGSATCLADASGALRCFGQGGNQLGFPFLGALSLYLEPTLVPSGPTDVVEVDTEDAFTCARTSGGAVWCWGGDAMPGNGSTLRADTPRLVDEASMGAVRTIAVGLDFACALAESDGRAWCWGPSGAFRGHLCGTGVATASTSCPRPVPVSGDRSFTSLAAGRSHVCGLTSGGEAWCWGFRGSGALGDGATTGFSGVPVRVGTIDDAIAVAPFGGAGNTTCVLRATGRVSCVGGGSNGALGNGSTSSSTTLVDVSGLVDATELLCLGSSCLARRAAGTWVGWGGDVGLLGSATSALSHTSPVPAAHGLSGAVWLGPASACGRRGEEVACWGRFGGWFQRALPVRSVRSAF